MTTKEVKKWHKTWWGIPLIIGILIFVVILFLILSKVSNCPECSKVELAEKIIDCPKLDCSTCPKIQEIGETIIKYQCIDGTIADKISDCSTINLISDESNHLENTVEEPDLLVTINSPSSSSKYLHNPIITISNEGGSVTNLVFDVELYRGTKLVASESNVYYMAGGSSIVSINANDSVKGYLNIMIYNGNSADFTPGNYVLKLIVRRGASAKSLATVEKEVTFS